MDAEGFEMTNIPTYQLASKEQLMRKSYFARLQNTVRSFPISEREWPTKIQNMLLKIDMQGGRIMTAPEPYPIPLIDDLAPERFIRDFLAAETCEDLEVARIVDLYFRALYPRIARHFDK